MFLKNYYLIGSNHIYFVSMYCYEKYYYVFYRIQEIGNNANVDVKTLLMQLRNAEERNQELLNKNKNLLEGKEFLEEKIKV